MRRFLFTLAASPFSANASHSWNGYHWARTSNPFTVQLGDNLAASWKPYLGTTSSDWSQSAELDTTVVTGQAKGRCRPTSGRVEVCNDTYGQNGWLGLAQIWLSGSHIAGNVGSTTAISTCRSNTAEKEHVMCQEVGHTSAWPSDESGTSLNSAWTTTTTRRILTPKASIQTSTSCELAISTHTSIARARSIIASRYRQKDMRRSEWVSSCVARVGLPSTSAISAAGIRW
jgi:hypothetical protein